MIPLYIYETHNREIKSKIIIVVCYFSGRSSLRKNDHVRMGLEYHRNESNHQNRSKLFIDHNIELFVCTL